MKQQYDVDRVCVAVQSNGGKVFTCPPAWHDKIKDPRSVILLMRASFAAPAGSVTATNNLAYLLARDALHTLAAAARQAPPGLEERNLSAGSVGTGLQFEDPSRGMMKAAEASSEASSKVCINLTTANLLVKKGGSRVCCGRGGGGGGRGGGMVPCRMAKGY